MRSLGLGLTLLIVFTVSLSAAPATSLNSENQPIKVSRFNTSNDGFSLSLEIDDPLYLIVDTDPHLSSNQPREALINEYSMCGFLSGEDIPAVPVVGRMFRLPPSGGVTVDVISAEYETVTGIDYAYMVEGDGGERFGAFTGGEDEWLPGKLADIDGPAIFHDFRVGTLVTYPVQFNPARREARVYNSIEVEVRFEGEDDRNTLPHWPTRISRTYLPWYRQLLDWDDNELDEYELYRGAVQVIMENDDILFEELEEWFEWKLQRGWVLEFLTDDDVNNWNHGTIQNELEDRFDEEPFDYIVIIGDDTGSWPVPAGSGPGYGAGDWDYTLLAGNDDLHDCIVGRISVGSTQDVAKYVNKVLYYERDLDTEDMEWLDRGLVSTSMGGLSSTIYVGRYVRHLMLDQGYTQVDTAWYNQNNYWGLMEEAIENGVGYFSHRGNSGLSSSTNDFMTPVVVEITCGPGDWSGTTGSSELWMRAGTVNNPRGAIGAMATATMSTHTRFNNIMSGGAGFAAFTLECLTVGDILFGAKQALYDNFHVHDIFQTRNFSQWLNLMGDPLVWFWMGEPGVLTVEADESLELGDNSYSVSVEDETGNPIEAAWVTLYKVDEDEEQIIRGETGPDGTVDLHAPFEFTGTAVLTVSMQNYLPQQIDVDIVSPEDRIGYSDISFLDDGTQGTSGNGNAIPEAGETVGLVITSINTGESQQQDVEVSGSCDDPWVDSITGVIDFGTLDAGEEVEGENVILVEITPEAQHEWILNIDLEFTGSTGTYDDGFPLVINAPLLAFSDLNMAGDLDPGDTNDFTVELANVGGSNTDPSTGVLTSMDEMLLVTDNTANIDNISVGSEATSGSFEVSADEYAFPGRIARLQLVVTTESGQVDTVYFSLTIGDRDDADPSGPDNYGYYAYESDDTDYQLAPEYDWVEICPDANNTDYDGERINMNDTGENTDNAEVVDLPFDFVYYGEEFDQVTITVNGYIAMGSQADMRNPRNWIIPSPLGPSYMIAPYWDDRTCSGNRGVYTYYDDDNMRFIIEWYEVSHYMQNQSLCTFQVILYDQGPGHYTLTGDNEILFQYKDLQHSNGDWTDVPWFTTGIENGDQSDGILISYWNDEGPGASPVSDETAILFTTNTYLIAGHVVGTVTRVENGDPIEGAEVSMLNGHISDVTDNLGNFHLRGIAPGTYNNLRVSCLGFNDATGPEFTIAVQETTTVNLQMTHPEIFFPADEIFEYVGLDERLEIPFTVRNLGNGLLDFNVEIHLNGPPEVTNIGGNNSSPKTRVISNELDDPWDLFEEYEISSASGEPGNHGIAFDGNNFWVSGSNDDNDDDPNKLYCFSHDGILLATFDQPVPAYQASSVGFYGLCWDGEYLYGTDIGVMYQMDVSPHSVETVATWEIPTTLIHYMAYEPDSDLFWMGERGSDLMAVNRQGEVVRDFDLGLTVRGAGWCYSDEDGYFLYLVSRQFHELTSTIYKVHPETGDYQEVFEIEDNALPAGADISFTWYPQIWVFIGLLDDNDNDYMKIWEISQNIQWLRVDPGAAQVEPNEDFDLEVTLDGTVLGEDVYSLWMKFNHNTIEQVSWIPVTVQGVVDVEDEPAQPLEWSFDGAYPNPFNPMTTVKFSLKEPSLVKAQVFNLLGQKVIDLADMEMNAGHHSLMFNGDNLASGMYFMRFEAGPINQTAKLLLMK